MFNNGLKKVVADLAEQVQQLAANADGHFGQHGLKSSNHSQDHEKHHHFSLATTTIPYYHLIVDCLNMLGPSPFPHAPSMPLEKVALALESTRGSRAGEGQGRSRGGEVVAGKGSLMTLATHRQNAAAGVVVMVVSLLGIAPLLILTIFPGMFQPKEAHKNHG